MSDQIRVLYTEQEVNQRINEVAEMINKDYAGKDEETPFDQHFMLSLIAPRKVHIASAEKDIWAGPNLQFLSCVCASEVYELYGIKGFCFNEDDFLKTDRRLNDGNIGLCHREGVHYFSRDDWHGLMEFLKL